MLKIIAGEFRSRQLQSPEGRDVTRPMSARVKESVFNLLRGWCDDAIVLDLFAGVGTIGLEAVSRGAREVVMVEQNRRTFRVLEANIAALGCGDRTRAVCGDALSPIVLTYVRDPINLLFVDPPFSMMQAEEQRAAVLDAIALARPAMAGKSFVVLRTPILRQRPLIPGFEGPETHSYGREMQVHLYMPDLANLE